MCDQKKVNFNSNQKIEMHWDIQDFSICILFTDFSTFTQDVTLGTTILRLTLWMTEVCSLFQEKTEVLLHFGGTPHIVWPPWWQFISTPMSTWVSLVRGVPSAKDQLPTWTSKSPLGLPHWGLIAPPGLQSPPTDSVTKKKACVSPSPARTFSL